MKKVQWAPNEDLDLELEVDQQMFEPEGPIHDTEAEVKQYLFTREELDVAIGKMKNNRAPGPNRVTPELIQLLRDERKDRLLHFINSCWDKEELFDEMNKADLAVICKKRSNREAGDLQTDSITERKLQANGEYDTE